MASITYPPTDAELAQVERANASRRRPVLFVHGLWLLASSWDRWSELFESRGYATLAPGWPDDPATVEEGRRRPELFAGKSIGAITAHLAGIAGLLTVKPAIIGHSIGGMIAQKLAGQGLAAVTVPIDPAPFRGVLPLPLSTIKAGLPVLRNPANRTRSVMLTSEQFRFAFASAVDPAEAEQLYDTHPVPGAGLPLFQAAFANANPRTDARVDCRTVERGPMKFLSGENDNTVPSAITTASYKRQKVNQAETEIQEMPGRGHSLVFDSGWQEVAEAALAFIDAH